MTTFPNPVVPGANLTYRITLANLGPDKANSITVTDTLPTVTTFASCSTTGGGACQGEGLIRSVRFGKVDPGASATITLVANVNPGTAGGQLLVNRARVKANSSDPDLGNNLTSVTATTATPSADLGLDLSAAPNPLPPASNVTYSLIVTNAGPSTASSVTLTDNLPSTLTFVGCVATGGGVCGGTGNSRSVSWSSLAPSTPVTATLTGQVKSATADGTVIGNTATVTTVTSDPSTANNSATASVTVQLSRPPDIVVVLTDDQPIDLLPLMPNVDALIGQQGVRFSNYYVSTPICGPSRATLFTGLYSHNHGVRGNGNAAARFDDTSTVATWLHDAGYRTALVGKYLNNYQEIAPYIGRGWDEWRVFVQTVYYDFDLVVNGTTVHYDSSATNYATNVLADHAVQVIEQTPSGQPLFLELAPFSPHAPATPAPDDLHALDSLAPYRPPSYNEADVSDKPLWVRELPLLTPKQDDGLARLHESMGESLQSVDRSVARIVDALSRTGRLANAVIILAGDNGYSLGAHRWEQKSCTYEECIRQPLLIRAPGIAPRDESALVTNVDLASTIAELAGVTPPTPVKGRSLVPLLRNPGTPWRDAVLLEYVPSLSDTKTLFRAVRTNRYVYAEYVNGDRELYDLALDPFELGNVVNDPAYAGVVSALQTRLGQLLAE